MALAARTVTELSRRLGGVLGAVIERQNEIIAELGARPFHSLAGARPAFFSAGGDVAGVASSANFTRNGLVIASAARADYMRLKSSAAPALQFFPN
jgi:hypothetical protein